MECDYEKIPDILPRDQVYTVKVGQKLYSITGATLSWDGPNFFTNYFQEHDVSDVLFLDRSVESFDLIYRHMQGYFIAIRDEVEYTTLFTDALFYSLPKLVRFLKKSEFYYVNVGGESFQVAKSLFKNDGDCNNYFQVVITGFYRELESRIVDKKLTISPCAPTFIPRSPEFFRKLLTLLSGVQVEMDDLLRRSLIRECRYYRFLRLEQELVKHRTLANPLANTEEICIHLNDVDKTGLGLRKPSSNTGPSSSSSSSSMVSVCLQQEEQHRSEKCRSDAGDNECSSPSLPATEEDGQPGRKKIKLAENNKNCSDTRKNEKVWDIVSYKRPYVDTAFRDLIFQLDSNECMLIFNKLKKTIHVDIGGSSAAVFGELFRELLTNEEEGVNVNLDKFQLSPPHTGVTSNHLVLPACVSLCDLQVNGIKCNNIFSLVGDTKCNERVPDFTDMDDVRYCVGLKLHIAKSLWKIGVKNDKIMLIAIKAVTYCSTKEYCKTIDFL